MHATCLLSQILKAKSNTTSGFATVNGLFLLSQHVTRVTFDFLAEQNLCLSYMQTIRYLDDYIGNLRKHIKKLTQADIIMNDGATHSRITFDNLHFREHVDACRNGHQTEMVVKTTAFVTFYPFPIEGDNTHPIDASRSHVKPSVAMQPTVAEYALLHLQVKRSLALYCVRSFEQLSELSDSRTNMCKITAEIERLIDEEISELQGIVNGVSDSVPEFLRRNVPPEAEKNSTPIVIYPLKISHHDETTTEGATGCVRDFTEQIGIPIDHEGRVNFLGDQLTGKTIRSAAAQQGGNYFDPRCQRDMLGVTASFGCFHMLWSVDKSLFDETRSVLYFLSLLCLFSSYLIFSYFIFLFSEAIGSRGMLWSPGP
jgi:hypothetical protein